MESKTTLTTKPKTYTELELRIKAAELVMPIFNNTGSYVKEFHLNSIDSVFRYLNGEPITKIINSVE